MACQFYENKSHLRELKRYTTRFDVTVSGRVISWRIENHWPNSIFLVFYFTKPRDWLELEQVGIPFLFFILNI